MSKLRTPFRILLIITILLIVGTLTWNLDVVVRAVHAIQTNSFTLQRLRFDIAAFGLGQSRTVRPIKSKTSDVDGMVQVLVPAGDFLMGRDGELDEDSPIHLVYLDSFWMDQVEVTNAMYGKCVREGSCTRPVSDNKYYGNWIYHHHPVVYVDWFQANEYCEWAGRELPTEAQWEKAARGTDGGKYPWGNVPPNPRLANFTESLTGESLSSFRYPLGASPYGVLNMSGNVREWVVDWFSLTYYQVSPYMNPTGPENGTERSLRSGAYDAEANEITTYRRYKHEPQSGGLSRGFRCAESSDVALP
jgi:formylglycine-generating enzyme required for sulfatase activity